MAGSRPLWALSPVLVWCFLLGLTSFTWSPSGGLVRNRLTRVASLLVGSLITALALLILVREAERLSSASTGSGVVVLSAAQALTTLLCMFVRRDEVWSVLARNVDYGVRETRVISDKNASFLFKKLSGALLAFTAVVALSNALYATVESHAWIAQVVVLLLIRMTGLLIFSYSIYLLMRQFQVVNGQLLSLGLGSPRSPLSVSLSVRRVQELRLLHCNLEQLAFATNRAFNPLLALSLTSLVLTLTMNVDKMLKFESVRMSMASFVAMLRELVILILVIVPCEAIDKTVRRTGEIVHDLLNKENVDKVTKEELRIFSLQIKNMKVVFSASGLFQLNCLYFCTVIGTVTTYNVILRQTKL